MTTDTFPKLATRQAKIGEKTVTINGFLKGSGMIAPDMATMLGFVFTDAKMPAGVLQKLLADAADKSLNCITVDGDTSTSDTLLLVATGAARHAPIEEADDPVLVDFKRALDEVLIELAQLLARDGEGATKFVTINVGGASSNGAARKIGLAVANSPLVKTAIAGEDANWGRIVMAVGKSGERADRDKLAHLDRRRPDHRRRPGRAGLRRGAGRQAHQGHRYRDRHRSRHRPRPRHRVDLRPDARLHRHQRQLPLLSFELRRGMSGRPAAAGRLVRSCWWRPSPWSISTVAC